MRTSIVKECDCIHKDQDELYGKQKRLMNIKIKSRSGDIYTKATCTVCGKERTVNEKM